MSVEIEFDDPDVAVIEIEGEGMQGPANVLEVLSIDTLEPDEPAWLVVEGNSPRQKVRGGIPRGKDGLRGPGVTVAEVDGYLCFRKDDDGGPWTEIVPMAALLGDSVVLRRSGGVVQWKPLKAAEWQFLYDLEDYRGGPGPAGAPGEPVQAMIGDRIDVGAGGWWLVRDYHGVATLRHLRAELIAGSASGVTLNLRKNGAMVRDGISLSDAAPYLASDLLIELAPGDALTVHRSPGGTIHGPWLALIQIDGRS